MPLIQAVIGNALALCATLLSPVPDRPTIDPDKRVKYLISRLDATIPEIEKGDVGLPFLLDILSALATQPTDPPDPALRFRIKVSDEAFSRAKKRPFEAERVQISFPEKVSRAPVETVLKFVCDQIDGACVVRPDDIEIIPRSQLRKELGLPTDDKRPLYPLVHRLYSATPFDQVLADLAKRYHAKIEIDPAIGQKAKTPVTVRLLNLPLEIALEKLAAEVGLKLVRKADNRYLMTVEKP